MTRTDARWVYVLAVCAGAILVLALTAAPRSTSPGRVGPGALILRAPAPVGSSAPPIDKRIALRVARRFASAYAAWDAGRRGGTTDRRLAEVIPQPLAASLERDAARPVAQPARPMRLTPLGAYRDGKAYIVPLGLAGPGSRQIISVVVQPTPRGARIARIER